MSIEKAMGNVRQVHTTVPPHLQDAHYKGSKKLGRGLTYLYAHEYPKHYVEQQYLPSEIINETFYEPSDNGYERQIKAHMKWIKGGAEDDNQ